MLRLATSADRVLEKTARFDAAFGGLGYEGGDFYCCAAAQPNS